MVRWWSIQSHWSTSPVAEGSHPPPPPPNILGALPSCALGAKKSSLPQHQGSQANSDDLTSLWGQGSSCNVLINTQYDWYRWNTGSIHTRCGSIEAAIKTQRNVLREKREKLRVLREIRAMEEDMMEGLWGEEREMVRFYSMQECHITCTLLSVLEQARGVVCFLGCAITIMYVYLAGVFISWGTVSLMRMLHIKHNILHVFHYQKEKQLNLLSMYVYTSLA